MCARWGKGPNFFTYLTIVLVFLGRTDPGEFREELGVRTVGVAWLLWGTNRGSTSTQWLERNGRKVDVAGDGFLTNVDLLWKMQYSLVSTNWHEGMQQRSVPECHLQLMHNMKQACRPRTSNHTSRRRDSNVPPREQWWTGKFATTSIGTQFKDAAGGHSAIDSHLWLLPSSAYEWRSSELNNNLLVYLRILLSIKAFKEFTIIPRLTKGKPK